MAKDNQTTGLDIEKRKNAAAEALAKLDGDASATLREMEELGRNVQSLEQAKESLRIKFYSASDRSDDAAVDALKIEMRTTNQQIDAGYDQLRQFADRLARLRERYTDIQKAISSLRPLTESLFESARLLNTQTATLLCSTGSVDSAITRGEFMISNVIRNRDAEVGHDQRN